MRATNGAARKIDAAAAPLVALSVCQPWAWAIVFGEKRIENRKWPTNHRGPLVIHASRGTRYAGDETEIPDCPPFDSLVKGAAIGLVDVVDCVPVPQLPAALKHDPYAEGPWCWILENPRSFAQPVEMRGFQSLFNSGLAIEHGLIRNTWNRKEVSIVERC